MKLPRPYTVHEIAALIGAQTAGDISISVTGINEIHVVEHGDVVFVDHPKYYNRALESAASVILINKEVDCPQGKALLVHADPFVAFNELTKFFVPYEPIQNAHELAEVHPSVILEPGVILGKHVKIDEGTVLRAGVVIYDHVKIGKNVLIHANTVIGSDAFYYQKRLGKYHKMHSCGGVVIEDDVEIGALCTIDRGVTSNTVIGEGTKLDNQIHIGHDTIIGKNCLLAAHVGVSGCVVIEDQVTLWGQAGVVANVRIGSGAVIMGQSGVSKNLEGGKSYLGSPCDDSRKKFREMASIRVLPQIIENLNG